MKYRLGYFHNKKITVMGLGLLGRGVGDVRFLSEEGAHIIVTDLKTEEELAPSLEALKGLNNITYILGQHRMEDFKNRDFILKSAGVPQDSPYIAEARKNNVPIEMSTALFAALTPAMIVGITGTRGKSTTSHLLYEILKHAFGTSKKVFLGGNVKGVSTLQFLRDTEPGDIVVLELDSWQLQGFGERKLSPHIAVFTTFLPDHLNYYHGDLAAYLADKAHIFLHQHGDDFFILGSQAAPMVLEKYQDQIHSTMIETNADLLPRDWKVEIPGLHNRYNAALALRAAQLFNVGEETIKHTIEHFRGVAGRLEFIREVHGVKIYNDTTATTPDATLAALRAFSTMKNTVLIMGGADKGLSMGHLFLDIPDYAKAVVTIPGSGTDRVKADIEKLKQEEVKVEEADTLAEAVEKALAHCRKGDNLVLSPGFASFGQFKNEFDRGDQFNEIVNEL
ncbi:MAG: UDP-N-acetylmuramoylalanine--D-glutamate ligase [Candidatus Paceibacter sp.]|jgi:UDP-N-acetylmuramoylalanine--D-glutamate ligase|nr:UDP-N-acetylmuramoylalanine--D-glutamate ligase [Candidatus Paceibacter sp.]